MTPPDWPPIIHLIFDTPGGDVSNAHAIYHDDAVLEFPQSGERFEGVETFTEWRSQYPAEVAFDVQRVVDRGDFIAVELTAQYDPAGPVHYGVQLLDLRDGKVARERIYVTEGWDPPEWRARWRSD
jgi:hypothetical protein